MDSPLKLAAMKRAKARMGGGHPPPAVAAGAPGHIHMGPDVLAELVRQLLHGGATAAGPLDQGEEPAAHEAMPGDPQQDLLGEGEVEGAPAPKKPLFSSRSGLSAAAHRRAGIARNRKRQA